MKFCTNCGNQLKENDKFCSSCGASISQEPKKVSLTEKREKTPEKNKKKTTSEKTPIKKIIPILCCAVVALTALAVFLNYNKYQRIDASELFKMNAVGIDGYGTLQPDFKAYDEYAYGTYDVASKSEDLTSLLEQYDDYEDPAVISPYFSIDQKTFLKAWSKASDNKEAITMRKALLKKNASGEYLVHCSVDKKDHLHNGDLVNVTVDYDEDYLKKYKIKLKNTQFTYTVEGLNSGTVIDPFDNSYFSISFSGMNENGHTVLNTDIAPKCFSYSIVNNTNTLKNGDSVTVEATCSETLFEYNDKYMFTYDNKTYLIQGSKVAKEFTVSGLSDAMEIDPFDGISFNFSGAVPFLLVDSIKKDNMPEVLKGEDVSYDIDAKSGLNVGDTFRVKVFAYKTLYEKGYKLSGEPDENGYIIKTYIIDNTYPSYVTVDTGVAAYKSFDSLINDKITDIRKNIKGSKFVGSIKLNGEITSITDISLIRNYVAFNDKSNYSNIGWGENINRVIGLHRINVVTDSEKEQDTLYVALYGDNIIQEGNKFTVPDLKISYYKTIEDFIADMVKVEGYTVVKCENTELDAVEKRLDAENEEREKDLDSSEASQNDSQDDVQDDSKDDSKKDSEDDSKDDFKDDSKDDSSSKDDNKKDDKKKKDSSDTDESEKDKSDESELEKDDSSNSDTNSSDSDNGFWGNGDMNNWLFDF